MKKKMKMKKVGALALAIGFFLSVAYVSSGKVNAAEGEVTPYFIAIHNEPAPVNIVAANYVILKRIVEKADLYNVKLTLMFPAQWSNYIAANSAKLAEVKGWEANGHEIAVHHHGVTHRAWDGYTDLTKAEVDSIRLALQLPFVKYMGSLGTFMTISNKIKTGVNAGCLNEELDKRELPDDIIYSTCSGFANTGEPGVEIRDTDLIKCKNDYITVGNYNDIERKWLAHCLPNEDSIEETKNVFETMESGVFGVIFHSSSMGETLFYNFLETVHTADPVGEKSEIMTDIIENQMIPEVTIPDELLN